MQVEGFWFSFIAIWLCFFVSWALFNDSKKRERIRYRVNKNLKRIGLYGLKIKFFNK
jgi:hypothetical protein